MKVFIIHYHMKTGGVTQIIRSQVLSLTSYAGPKIKVRLILGVLPEEKHQVLPLKDTLIHPDLDYIDPDLSHRTLEVKRSGLNAYLRKHISREDIIHAHNLNLGKNPVLTMVLYDMAKEGYKVFNHYHDFAENARYTNYGLLKTVIEGAFNHPLAEVLYPSFPNYAFAVLNARDYEILLHAGIPQSRVSLLMNPVDVSRLLKKKYAGPRSVRSGLGIRNSLPLFVYPIRAIKRKNIGEFLLLSALFSDRGNWIISQPPLEPWERKNYRFWMDVAAEFHLPVVFEGGKKVDYPALLQVAEKIVTTSVAEGFGMSFLECWLYGKSLVGRDIPEITRIFRSVGIQYEQLYESLEVPVNWVRNMPGLVKDYIKYMSGAYQKFGFSVPVDLPERIRRCRFSRPLIDFAVLDNKRQRQLIADLLRDSGKRSTFITLNNLERFFAPARLQTRDRNAAIIAKKMNLYNYRKKLISIYHGFYKSSRGVQQNAGRQKSRFRNPVARAFLKPRYFYIAQEE
jgi:hypothetical protein